MQANKQKNFEQIAKMANNRSSSCSYEMACFSFCLSSSWVILTHLHLLSKRRLSVESDLFWFSLYFHLDIIVVSLFGVVAWWKHNRGHLKWVS
jgi:hypothetical protein